MLEFPLPPMEQYLDEDLQLILDVPEGWGVMPDGQVFPLQIFAPPDEDYQASLAIIPAIPPRPFSADDLAAYVDHTYYQGNLKLSGFVFQQGRLLDISGYPAALIRYDWVHEELGLELAQIDAFILREPELLFKVHGYSLKALEARYLPVIIHMIVSIQFFIFDNEN